MTPNFSEIAAVFDGQRKARSQAQDPIPTPKRVKEGTVIDEDKSVKWNRDEVVRLNALHKAHWDARIRAESAHNAAFETACREAITQAGLIRAASDLIWSAAYERGHANGFFSIADELNHHCDFALLLSQALQPSKQ